MVAVNAGSSCETPDTRGATHFIEHMAFDGSERYTREEISGWVDDVGGFLNAFTRKETTVFFLLVPSVHFERGVEILSQMLLHSVFPPAGDREGAQGDPRGDPPRAGRSAHGSRGDRRSLSLPRKSSHGAHHRVSGDDRDDERVRPENLLRRKLQTLEHENRHHRKLRPEGGRAVHRRIFPLGLRRGTAAARRAPRCGATRSPRIRARPASRASTSSCRFPRSARAASPRRSSSRECSRERALRSPKSLEALSLPAPETSLEIHRGFAALRIHVGAAEGGGSAGSRRLGRSGKRGLPQDSRGAREPRRLDAVRGGARQGARVVSLGGDVRPGDVSFLCHVAGGRDRAPRGPLPLADRRRGGRDREGLREGHQEGVSPAQIQRVSHREESGAGRARPKTRAPGMPGQCRRRRGCLPGWARGCPRRRRCLPVPPQPRETPGYPRARPGIPSPRNRDSAERLHRRRRSRGRALPSRRSIFFSRAGRAARAPRHRACPRFS